MTAASIRLLKFALALGYSVFDTSRAALCGLIGYRISAPVVVLMYHSIKREERARFAEQMNQLVRLAQPVYADFRNPASDGRRYVAVTFDDGYHSVLENAFPILRERGIPSTMFVPAQHVGNRPGWITDQRHRDASERLMTPDELREMQKHGTLIGSHGMTHRALTRISQTEMAAELADSRKTLADMVDQRVDLFALPYGAGNADVYNTAVALGYAHVFLNVPVRQNGTPECLVGRIEVSPTDWPLEYRLKVCGAYQWMPWAMAAKRRLVNVLRQFVPRTSEH